MADSFRHFFMDKEKAIMYVLFDGDCNLCNRTVRFISKRNKLNRITLLPLQSERARELIVQKNIDPNVDSVIFVGGNAVYYESKAILAILKKLNYPYRLVGQFASIFPESLLNFLYRIVAKNRYRWFGKAKIDSCERSSS